jgi:signal peptidase I
MRQIESSEVGSALKCELAAEVLRSFGTLRFAATGWSMLPCVWPGETLVVERVQPDQVRIGQLVLFGREGRLCAHRVIGTQDDPQNPQWITQGDALPVPDRPVAREELLGRVAYLIRAGKRIEVPIGLNVIERLTARIIRRSFFAARVLVYLRRVFQAPKESVLPCQG